MKKYDTIAVLDFVDINDELVTDDGRTLAHMIRKQLESSEELNILDERTTNLNLEEEITKDKIEDEYALISIANQLGADALIVGMFDFKETNMPIPYVVERYSSTTGRYVPETRTYIRRSHHLSFHAKVIDGETGETIFEYSPRSENIPEYRNSWDTQMSRQRSRSLPTSFRGMATRPVAMFTMSLVPHYEYEQRILAR